MEDKEEIEKDKQVCSLCGKEVIRQLIMKIIVQLR